MRLSPRSSKFAPFASARAGGIPGARPRRFRPEVFALEDRTVPATALGNLSEFAFADMIRGVTGSGLNYEASAMYVTSDAAGTHTTTAGGAVNLPGMPAALNVDGVAKQLMHWTDGQTYGGSGTLLSSGRHVLTAAHNVTDGPGQPYATSVDFFWQVPNGSGGVREVTATGTTITFHSGYNGDFFDVGNDIAIITLDAAVDAAVPRYDIYRDSASELDALAVKVGYGKSGHGSTGANIAWGTKRAVLNQWDSDARTFGAANGQHQLGYDFDSGQAANDGYQYHFGFPADLGYGGDEGGSAPGDSGGPSFLYQGGQWVVAGVTSYGIRFGNFFSQGSDYDGSLNSSWGEFGADTRVSSYVTWVDGITGQTPPPPVATTDLSITSVSPAAASVVQGGSIQVAVTVKNTGNVATASAVEVTLRSDNGTADPADDFTIGTLPTSGGLAVGSSETVTFTWDTLTTNDKPGNHTLTASLPADDNLANNTGSATVTVTDPSVPQTPLYLTIAESGTTVLGGLSVQNEDIVLYQGGVYTMFFDGTPALGGSSGGFAIDAFAVLNDTQVLVSVDQYGGVNGQNLTVYDEDIILFTKSGSAWVASMYFDGSDVGLTTSALGGTGGAEGVDAIEVHAGKILISTKGNFSVKNGLSGADEDVIAFAPTSTGANTAGKWSMYFDGSNYGLSNGGDSEDVDAISVDNNGKLYLSTKGAFAVSTPTGPLSGTGSDVFVFTGSAYSPTVYFAGSNLGGKSLFSIDLPPGFAGSSSSPVRLSQAVATGETGPTAAATQSHDGLADLPHGWAKALQFGGGPAAIAAPAAHPSDAATPNVSASTNAVDAVLNLFGKASAESRQLDNDWTGGLDEWLRSALATGFGSPLGRLAG